MDRQLQRLTRKRDQLKKLLANKPVDFAFQLDAWIRVELTYSSNYIEGNTLSRQETAEVIAKGTSAIISGKPLIDQLEALNHAQAVDQIKQIAHDLPGHQHITAEHIKQIHHTILSKINDANAGNYRQVEVFIRGADDVSFPYPNLVSAKMQDLIEWLDGQQKTHPAIIASELHHKFVSIHPFIDGNGRTARLLMNLVLLLHNYPLAIIQAEQRQEYLSAIHKYQTTNNSVDYYKIIFDAIERSLDAYLNLATSKSTLKPLQHVKPVSRELLKIGQLAKLAEVSIPTIRHYLKLGLISYQAKSKGKYLLFSPQTANVVKEIRRLAIEKRLTLAEIKTKLTR